MDYYRNGNLEKEAEYINNELNGSFKSFHSNGKLYLSGTYKKGLRYGTWKEYTEDGLISEISNYDEKGNFDGDLKSFDETGNHFSTIIYDKGKVKQFTYQKPTEALLLQVKPEVVQLYSRDIIRMAV
ncbi:MAG: hypothetical protein HC905_19950 [Bacteroidales bacterium]|nr:hypothetical protein [Bacteroidales bacterium]